MNKSTYDFTKIPFNNIIRLGQRNMLYRDLFTVSWLLGRFCNYHCSYCWTHGRSDDKDHRPTELCLRTVDEIKRQARERGFNSFHFSLSGGEPTLHPGYLDILRHLGDDVDNTNYTSIHMTSNCSPGIRWFEKYVQVAQPFHRASITCSYHREYNSEYKRRVKLADKLELCQEWNVQITINCVMVPEWFWQIMDEVMYFHERGINVTLKPQSDPNANFVVEGYDDKMLEQLHNGMPQRAFTESKNKHVTRPKPTFIKTPDPIYNEEHNDVPQHFQVEFVDNDGKYWFIDQAERFNAFEFNSFKDWECSSGYRGIIIREPDGSIKRSYSCDDDPLGYIYNDFKLFDKPMPCISNSCVSSADSKIPKRKPGVKLPLWPGDKTYDRKT